MILTGRSDRQQPCRVNNPKTAPTEQFVSLWLWRRCRIGSDLLQCDWDGEASWQFYLEYIGTFFKNIFNGCRDYVNMVPGKITLATSQC